MIKKRWFLNILVTNKCDKGSKCFLLSITIIDDRTFFLLRPAIQPHVLVHPSHKMIGSCVNILARTRNNPKEPLIAVIWFRIFSFTVETLNCHNTFFKSKRSVGLLLITVKHRISEFSHVRRSNGISTRERSSVGGGQHPSLIFLLHITVKENYLLLTLRSEDTSLKTLRRLSHAPLADTYILQKLLEIKVIFKLLTQCYYHSNQPYYLNKNRGSADLWRRLSHQNDNLRPSLTRYTVNGDASRETVEHFWLPITIIGDEIFF